MKPRVSVVNLGVSDVARTRAFYEGMGFPVHPASGAEAVFFEGDWAWLGIFSHQTLNRISGTAPRPQGEPWWCLSTFVSSPEEVDRVLAQAVGLGGTLAIEPESGNGNYIGYFADPDGYRWEVAYSPQWMMLAE